jgi:hypothetical protein
MPKLKMVPFRAHEQSRLESRISQRGKERFVSLFDGKSWREFGPYTYRVATEKIIRFRFNRTFRLMGCRPIAPVTAFIGSAMERVLQALPAWAKDIPRRKKVNRGPLEGDWEYVALPRKRRKVSNGTAQRPRMSNKPRSNSIEHSKLKMFAFPASEQSRQESKMFSRKREWFISILNGKEWREYGPYTYLTAVGKLTRLRFNRTFRLMGCRPTGPVTAFKGAVYQRVCEAMPEWAREAPRRNKMKRGPLEGDWEEIIAEQHK